MNAFRLAGALLLAFVALAMSISLAWSQSQKPAVRIQPASLQVSAGNTFQLTVEIHDVVNLGAFQFDLTYDSTIVQVDSIALGDFPGRTGRSVNPLGPRIEAGKAVYGAFSFGDTAGPDGSGPLGIVTLQAQAEGQTPVGLQNVQVIDVGGTHIPVSTEGGMVTVSGSPPVPGQAAATAASQPTLARTATVDTLLSTPRRDAIAGAALEFPLVDWVITGAALVGIVALVVLAARLMAR
ncbi:MAG: cohesin domain-containing protein [Anaerolineae bacterium]